jgi:hypothetical protein
MKRKRKRFALAVLLLAGSVFATASIGRIATASLAAAHDHGSQSPAASLHHELAQVRRATARFHSLNQATAAGYELGWVNGSNVRILTGCVSHPTAGAMGYHYINPALVADNAVDLLRPEALVYESTPDGGRKLVAVEWIVRSAQSNPPGVSAPPSVLGMAMHILVPPPGPAFYLMHAWIWKHNPAGIMADWNPEVTCP